MEISALIPLADLRVDHIAVVETVEWCSDKARGETADFKKEVLKRFG